MAWLRLNLPVGLQLQHGLGEPIPVREKCAPCWCNSLSPLGKRNCAGVEMFKTEIKRIQETDRDPGIVMVYPDIA